MSLRKNPKKMRKSVSIPDGKYYNSESITISQESIFKPFKLVLAILII